MEPGIVDDEDPVVIVGFSFRFPQDAVSEDKFWDIIRQGSSTMTEVPASRYNIDGFHAHGKNRPGTVSPTYPLPLSDGWLLCASGST